MALENITEIINPLNKSIWGSLPPEILAPFAKLIAILQIAGIVVITYLAFLLIKGILGWKRHKRIDITYKKVLEIDKKLDKLLNKTERKENKIEKQEKKPGLFSKLFRKKEKKIEKIEKKIEKIEKNIKEK